MWEIINDIPSYRRLKVPGGWLVQIVDGTGPVFISDSNYSWNPITGSSTTGSTSSTTTGSTNTGTGGSTTTTTITTKWLGTNLMEVRDWSTDFPFLNFFYKSRKWIIGIQFGTWDTGIAPTMDSLGNLLSLPGSTYVARCVMFSAWRPVVDFDLTWTGSGTITINGATVKSSSPNHIVFTPNASGNTWFDLSAVDPTNPPKNFVIKRVDQLALTGLFNPDFLADMSKYACIRFMDWSQTNYNRTQTQLQNDFAPLNALPVRFTGDGDGVPLSVQIELCNQVRTNGWFHANINADSNYINTLLTQINTNLASNVKAYVELGNEPWNTAYGFNTYLLLSGSTFDQKMNSYALRAADLAFAKKTILGTKGISILGSQDTATFWQEQLIKDIQAAGKTIPDALTIAPYFGLGIADTTSSFDNGSLLASAKKEISNVLDAKKIANKYGIGLVCYEGGCSVMPGTVVNRDSRIGPIYTTYLSGIKAVLTGSLFNHYSYVSSYSSNGSWGEKEFEYEAPTAKSLAISGSF